MKIAVVGGGAIGLFVAHYLERAGAEVTLIDRGATGGACSSGNAGWICPSICFPLPSPGLALTSLAWLLRSDSPLYIRPGALPALAPWLWSFRRFCNAAAFRRGAVALSGLASETLSLFEELEQDGIAFEHARRGLMMVFRSREALEEKLVLLELTGYSDKLRTLSPEQLAMAEPALAPGFAGGILAEPEWHVRPESLCEGLTDSLRGRGVSVLEAIEVRRFDAEGDRVSALRVAGVASGTAASDEAIEADAYVLATGAECGRLSALLGCSLPVQAGKGYSFTIAEPRVEIGSPLYFAETRLAMTPFEGSLRVAGTMELSGINTRIAPRRVRTLERAAAREVPGVLDGERSATWVGMRPITPDGLPFIGRLPTATNVYVATGHQMLGMTLAPATGRALAEAMLGGTPQPDLATFDPGRFY